MFGLDLDEAGLAQQCYCTETPVPGSTRPMRRAAHFYRARRMGLCLQKPEGTVLFSHLPAKTQRFIEFLRERLGHNVEERRYVDPSRTLAA